MNWIAKDKSRFVEVWEPHNARKMFTITSRQATAARMARCAGRGEDGSVPGYNSSPGDDRFTISLPGISDVIRIPFLETKQLRHERAARWRASHSALPGPLQPITRILQKLDDAQDLLFTAIALAVPILRFAGVRFIPFLGWALTINDILNGAT
jgi:hypothetical protein